MLTVNICENVDKIEYNRLYSSDIIYYKFIVPHFVS